MKTHRRLVGDKGGIKFQGKIAELREDGCINTLTAVLKDNPILKANNEMATSYSEVELRPDSKITPLGDCRYNIDGRTIEFAIRKLSPRECYRLMDVPENVIDTMLSCDEEGRQIISNSQHYRMAGNSIVVSCMYHIFKQLWYPEDNKPIPGQPAQLSLF